MRLLSELARKQFEYAQDKVISPLDSNDLRVAVVPLSCVRLFDSTMMMAVLQATNPNLFGIWDIEDFGDLLNKFRSSGLLDIRHGYSIHEDTRSLILPHLKYNEKVTYRKAHTAALQVYRDWLGRPVDNRSLYVREEIYHFASLNPRKDLKPVLSDRVKEYPLWLRDVAFCDRALETLWHYIDEDIELRDLSSQVPALLDLVSNSF